MRKIITGACVSLVVILIIFLVVTKLELKLASGSFPESVYAEEKSGSTSSGSATSGKLFVGSKLRSYPNRIFSNNNQNHAFGNGTVAANELNCEKWSVVTTIFPPSEAVRRQAHMTGWCLVVVGDRKGPETCQCCISSSFFVFLLPTLSSLSLLLYSYQSIDSLFEKYFASKWSLMILRTTSLCVFFSNNHTKLR